jgi:acyl-CoA reductase-like NAD-dependent aldehyde dehydrogenase
MAICTGDDAARRRVLDEARVGIVQVGAGPLAVHPGAPFGGWKASGFGPPEHGEWDAAFFTRPQARYEGG